MKYASFHLNLLKASEKVSSSPVRIRVLLPMLALLASAGMAVWWGIIFTQLMVVRSQVQTVEEDIQVKSKDHSEALARQAEVQEKKIQLEQLEYYKAGVRKIGEPLARLAEVMPLRVQITELTIPPPPPQMLLPNGGKVPLFGPVENVETQQLVIVGRTTKETPVVAMMESLYAPEFSTLVTKDKKVKSFRQDSSTAKDGKRLLSFEVEYTMPERRFSK